MVLDTSAIIALLWDEPLAPRLLAALEADPVRQISAASVVECSLVLLARYGEAAEPQLDVLLRTLDAEVVAVDPGQARIARDAATRFGRGRHHAALNFGDCFSYALAMAAHQPLLFVGNDFAATDVPAVHY